jgi:uncharacterized RDD family membrane protein YckC
MLNDDQVRDETPIHPWARFWARSVDLALFFVIVVLAVPGWYEWAQVSARLVVYMLTPLAWTVPEALFLSSIRTTPGKWALGLRVEAENGDRLTFGAAWKRAAQVWLRGLGAGIPIVSLFTLGRAYAVLVRERRASWDADERTRVRARSWKPAFRAGAAAASVTAAVLLFLVATRGLPGSGLEDEAVQALSEHRHQTEHWVGKSGATLDPISEVERGALPLEGTESFSFHLEAGERAVVLAACDLDCYDLDVAVVSPAGDTLAYDDAVDAWPLVRIRAPETGAYVATVRLYECDAEPCWYAAQAFRSTWTDPWTSTGTCFAVSRDGLLVTARHVVENADRIRVTFTDGHDGDAEVIAEDADHDVAVLRTGAVPPDVLGLAGPDQARLGTHVFTIGFPATDLLGKEPKYTEGAIAALSGFQDDMDLLQVSVPIQPGNSGGPLVNERGEVLGVIDATATPRAFELETGTLPQNVNWATKIDRAAAILPPGAVTPEPAVTREDAVARTYGAVCYVEAEVD